MDFTHERDVLKLDTDKCHLTNNNELLPEVVSNLSKISKITNIKNAFRNFFFIWVT